MTRTWEVCRRWVAVVNGAEERQVRSSNVFWQGDQIYSYGTHFEMARALRGRKNELTGFLVNGETYSPTTSRHQSDLRSAVQSFDHVVIPYGALHAAGIDLDTVQIIEDVGPTWDTREEFHEEEPPNAVWGWTPINQSRERFPEEKQELLDLHNANLLQQWECDQKLAADYRTRTDLKVWERRTLAAWLVKRPEPDTWEQMKQGHGRYFYNQCETIWAITGYRLACWRDASRRREWAVEWDTDHWTYSYKHERHRLGESLVRAQVGYTTTPRCPACKGRPPEGPTHRTWVEQRESDWLRPDYTRFDVAYSRAIDTRPPHCERCDGRGRLRLWKHRWAYFLSGWDHQEARTYFFCELEKGARPTTVDEAYECLKPDTVKIAEQMGREAVRQGDIFAIPTSVTTRELTKQGGSRERMGQLLGTNHVATEVVRLGKLTYARGVLWHQPAGRRPDHVRQAMGRTWHLIVKNTVPVSI